MSDNVQPAESRRPYGRQLSDLWLDGEEGKLHPAERKLLECARAGRICTIETNRPAAGSANNRIRGEFLRFLALGGDETHPVHEHGLTVIGGFIDCQHDVLDFSGTTIPSALEMVTCAINGSVSLFDSKTKTLSFTNSSVDGISCLGTDIDGDVYLDQGFSTTGQVKFANGTLTGDLKCEAGRFRDPHISIDLCGAKISGAVGLNDGVLCSGTVLLSSAAIDGSLNCSGGTFSSKSQSLHAPRATIGGNVSLGTGCCVAGEVSFQGAKIGGDITFQGGVVRDQGRHQSAQCEDRRYAGLARRFACAG